MTAESPQPAAYIRLTDPAFEDLKRLAKSSPQALRWALKKMIMLETNPNAGEPLVGDLINWRKLVVGDRDWRVVWRVNQATDRSPVLTIAEVWAVGARAEAEVYEEMRERIQALPRQPQAIALADAVRQLGRLVGDLIPSQPPDLDPVPGWLVERLVHTAGMDPAHVQQLSGEEAVDAWTEWRTTHG